jgi:hypothetical protein
MANIRLKELLEANVDPKLVARSKETGKLVYFKNAQNKAAAMKAGTHLDPSDKKGSDTKADATPNDMFGGDYAKDRGGEAPKSTSKSKNVDYFAKIQKLFKDNPGLEKYTIDQWNKENVKSIVKGILKTADKEFRGVHKLKDIMDDLNIDDTDGGAGNMLQVRIDRGEDGVYVQTDETEGVVVFNDGTQYKLHHVEDGPIPVTQIGVDDSDVDGQTDDELYDALYDMGYDFGELGSDDFDEEGFADAAMNLGYRYDDKNKVWNHRDTIGGSESPNINSKNWKKTDGDGRMSSESADDVRNYLNNVLGVDGVAEVDFGSGNIQYGLSDGENSIFVGNDGGTYNVSFEGPSMDLDKIEQSYKSFKNPKDALLYAGELAKANRKGLEQKQESTKLTSMIKK